MSTPGIALQYAEAFHAQGWCVLRLEHGEKKPPSKDKGWQLARHTTADLPAVFDGTCNVGVNLGEPSGGLVDIDLDAPEPEALELMVRHMPRTLEFGRASKPRSHRLYVASGAWTAQFHDPVDDKMLIEHRATPRSALGKGVGGSQTMMPGSTHPSGEAVRFEAGQKGLPLVIDAAELLGLVEEVASAILICRRRGMAQALAFLEGDRAGIEGLEPVDLAQIRKWLHLDQPKRRAPALGGGAGGGGPADKFWIDAVKAMHPADVATALGYEADHRRGMSPCPGCGDERRGSDDSRPAAGFVVSHSDGRTFLWTHKKCRSTGDALALASRFILNTHQPRNRQEWRQVRQALRAAGVLQ